MEFLQTNTMKSRVGNLVVVVLVMALVASKRAESRKARILDSFEYSAMNCRAHSASITDFGGVGDGKTSNTKAFQDAINHWSQYEKDGGSLLFVPAGKWLTGSSSGDKLTTLVS